MPADAANAERDESPVGRRRSYPQPGNEGGRKPNVSGMLMGMQPSESTSDLGPDNDGPEDR
jgi:hypothetical protein